MLEDALNYPFRGENSTERLVVGGALPFLSAAIYIVGLLMLFILVGMFVMPFAIVPRVLLWGYLVTVVAAVLVGQDEPPGFDDWKRIGVDGLKAVLVTLGYSIPLIILVFAIVVVTGITGSVAEQAGSSGPVMVAEIIWVVFGLFVALYSLVMYYVLPAAIVNYVREDDVAAAFHLRTISDIAFDGDYLVAWLLAAVVLVVGSLVAIPLYFVLVGFILRFYTLVVAAYLVTRGSMESMGWTTPARPSVPPSTDATDTEIGRSDSDESPDGRRGSTERPVEGTDPHAERSEAPVGDDNVDQSPREDT